MATVGDAIASVAQHDPSREGDVWLVRFGVGLGEYGVSRTAEVKSCVRVATGIPLRHWSLTPASAAFVGSR